MIVVRPVVRNALDPIDDTCDPVSKITDVKLLQDWKALLEILVTDAGIVIVVRPVPMNAYFPIDDNVESDSKLTVPVKLLQPLKASSVFL